MVRLLAFLLIASSFFFLFGCTSDLPSLPYNTAQLISRSTDLNYAKFIAGDYNNFILQVDGNKITANDCITLRDGNTVCGLVDVNMGVVTHTILADDTNWQTSWSVFDANMRNYFLTKSNPGFDGNMDFVDGNIIYVPCNEDIETYVNNAQTGDTLILGSCTYNITDDIDVTKAVQIKGQGQSRTTIANSTTGKNLFHITTDNVTIKDLSVTSTSLSGGTNRAIYVDGTAGNVFTNVRVINVDITGTSTGGALAAILYDDAGGTIKNVNVDQNCQGTTNNGILLRNNASAETTTTLKVYNTYVTSSGVATTNYGFSSQDISATQDGFLYLYDSKSFVSGATTNYGLYASSGDAYAYAYSTTFSGTQGDVVVSSSAVVQLNNCTLVNGLMSGGQIETYTSNFLEKMRLASESGVVAGTNEQIHLISDRAAIVADNLLGGIDVKSNDTSLSGGQQTSTAYLRFLADGTHTATSLASKLDLLLTPANSITPVSVFRVDSSGGVDLNQVNVTYVPIGGSINTYITNATAGDTLVLAAGTYTITASINVSKALNIVGQGVNQTIIRSDTNGINIFNVTADNVSISNLSINATSASGNSRGIFISATAGTVFSNCRVNNVNISMTGGTSTTTLGIYYIDAGGEVRDTNISVTGDAGTCTGLTIQNNSTAEADTTLNVFNVKSDITMSAGTAAYPFRNLDNVATSDSFFNLYNVYGNASGAAPSAALFSTGGDAITKVYYSYFNGSLYDLSQSTSSSVTVYNTTLQNSTINGTIVYDGEVRTKKLYVDNNAYFGAKVGIGTTNPNYNLHIGSSSSGSYTQWTDGNSGTTTNDGLIIGTTGDAGSAWIINRDPSPLRFYTNNTERMRINSDGNVGIGTTAPAGKLEIRHTADDQEGLLLSSAQMTDHNMTSITGTDTYFRGTTISNALGGAQFFGLSGGDQTALRFTGIIGSADPTDTNPAVLFRGGKKNGTTWQAVGASETAFQFANYATNLVTVLGSGNVGIGTTSPSQLLHVNGNILLNDNNKIMFGDASDATISYGGVDLNINPKSVGSGKVNIQGNLNIDGNFFGNQIYGEDWNKATGGFETIDLVTPEEYVRVTRLGAGTLNGFTVTDGNLIAVYAGLYQVNLSASAEAASAGGEYGLKVFVNDTEKDNCYSHQHLGLDAESMSINCFIRLVVGDKVNVRFDDHADPVRDIIVSSMNLNLVRIGN